MKLPSHRVKAALILVVAVILCCLPGLRLPLLDRTTDDYFNSAISRAGISYAVCRTVNATVSVVKESHLEIEPAGVGVSLALGQIVDPVYDLTERASDVLITAIVSLGIQKVSYEICVALAPPVSGVLIVCLLVCTMIKREKARMLGDLVARLLIIVIVGRFCLPISSVVNRFLYDDFFSPRIAAAKAAISLDSPALERLKASPLPDLGGSIMNGLGLAVSSVKDRASDLANALLAVQRNSQHIIDSLLTLTWVYVALFIVQVILLPLLSFWVLVKVANSLFSLNVPYMVRHAQLFAGDKPIVGQHGQP